MKIMIQCYGDEHQLNASTNAIKTFAALYKADLKGGILHYPEDFEILLPEDQQQAADLVNAIHALRPLYCFHLQIVV